MDIKKLEVLEATVRLNSLTRAAGELGITQSGVSHIIAGLERDFGFTPKIGIREGLRKFAEWYKEFYQNGEM